MLILLHVIVAFSSMGFTSYTYVSPSKSKLLTSYALAIATLGSGIFLITRNPAHLLPACIMGIIYLSIVGVAIYAAQHKLARAANTINS